MSGLKIEGEIRAISDGCTAHEMGIDAARQLLCVVIDPMRDQNVPKEAMQDLLLGLLAGTVGLFARDLSREEIRRQLGACQRMVLEVPGFVGQADHVPAGKGVH